MSTETKIGLIIGLGFIVCFAVLLANTNPEQNSTVQWTHVVEGAGTNKIQPRPQRQPLRARPAVGTQKLDRAIPRPKSPPILEDRTAEAQPLPAPAIQTGTSDRIVDADRSMPSSTDPPMTNMADRAARLQQFLDDARRSSQASQTPASESITPPTAAKSIPTRRPKNIPVRSPERMEKPARKRTATLVRHTVVTGDTLSKIAQKYYATRSRRVIDAIFDSNRTILTGPDRLSIGMNLTLPQIDGITRLASSRSSQAKVPAARSTKGKSQRLAKPAESKWYQIKKNDRYVSIARTQLGDGSRWKEIHELNKDRFPDPGKIQWGVKIRLPAVRPTMAGRN